MYRAGDSRRSRRNLAVSTRPRKEQKTTTPPKPATSSCGRLWSDVVQIAPVLCSLSFVYRLSTLLNNRQPINPCAAHFLCFAPRPNNFQGVEMVRLSQANGHWQLGLGKITARRHDLPGEGLIPQTHFDDSTDGRAIAPGADQLQSQPMVLQRLIISQQNVTVTKIEILKNTKT